MKTIKVFFGAVLAATFTSTMNAQKTQSDIPPYTKVPAGYLIVLRQGDDVFEELEALTVKEDIPSANFTGMGFVTITFVFFYFQKKTYDPVKEFKNVELVGMHGTVTWQNG